MTKEKIKLHYPDPGMTIHGENACKYHNFEKYDWKTDRNKPAMFWLYFEDDYKLLANHTGKKYVFWHNSDVRILLNNRTIAQYIPILRDESIIHVCHNALLQGELSSRGIYAVISPIFWGDIYKYKRQSKFTDDCYITVPARDHRPETDRGMEYGETIMNTLAWQFPDWNFHIFGVDPIITVYCHNLHYYGWITEDEMDKITDSFGTCLRFNFHDGFSQTVMKALVRGQRVITTIDYGPITLYCKNYQEISDVFINELDHKLISPETFNNFNFLEL